MDTATAVALSVVAAATPLLLAALGELVAERAGVLNLGVEGMMLMGAVTAFVAASELGTGLPALLAGAAAGVAMAALFAVLVLVLLANQVASGLALTLFGLGLSALIGRDYVGRPVEALTGLEVSLPPILGPLILGQDPLVYLSFAGVAGVAWFLRRTRSGMVLRAVGENADAAHALGHAVTALRWRAVLFGGAMAGLGGAYLSLAYTPLWSENMTAGRGWIALALVVFATWRPWRLLIGAYVFGAVDILQLHIQALGLPVASQFLSMLPYLATIAVLVAISADATRIRLNAPAGLGRVFHPGN